MSACRDSSTAQTTRLGLEPNAETFLLRGLLKTIDWTATREVVEAVRSEFRIGRSTVYRMIARFRASRKASSLIPTGRGTPDGAKRLDVRTERLIGRQRAGDPHSNGRLRSPDSTEFFGFNWD